MTKDMEEKDISSICINHCELLMTSPCTESMQSSIQVEKGIFTYLNFSVVSLKKINFKNPTKLENVYTV